MSTETPAKKNYKDTVRTPKTDFPMKADLVAREPQRLAKWEAGGLYQRIMKQMAGKPKFILHDGPPFANGDVHMGTALNKVLKDLIVKSKTMAGFHAPFIPGWDCHGLPIEFKVVKEAKDLAPAEVRTRSEAYARKFIDIQRQSFKRLGVFGDWENPYLTLTPGYEAEIMRTFAKFMEKGLIYRAKRPVLWSFGAQTALAEAEVEYKEKTSPAVYVKFQCGSGVSPDLAAFSLVIWTTTPWTLPANLGIALHMAGRDPEAVAVLEPVTKQLPQAFPAFILLGTSLMRLGQPAKAVAPLERAVQNLVDNACKFAPDGPIEVTVHEGIVLVRDHGPGLSPADIPHLFDRFYRSVDMRSKPGSGLGLAIVKSVVDAHGGQVVARNAADGGAELGFVLPLLARSE